VEGHPEATREIVASQLRAMNWMRQKALNLLKACEWTLRTGRSLSQEEPSISAEEYAKITKRDLLDLLLVPTIPDDYLKQGGSLYKEFEFLVHLNKYRLLATGTLYGIALIPGS